ncbi:hypothetical protein D3C71_739860 [compost metagenome]
MPAIRRHIGNAVRQVPDQRVGQVIELAMQIGEFSMQSLGLGRFRTIQRPRIAAIRHERLAIDLSTTGRRFVDDDRPKPGCNKCGCGTDTGRSGADDERLGTIF